MEVDITASPSPPGPSFDAAGVFDDDYLYFFADRLEERGDAEAGLIWRLLELQPGMRVLDLACGHGRIANRLAARGCHVTGLDAEPAFLRRARRDAGARGVTVEYVHGDMRELGGMDTPAEASEAGEASWAGRFDRAVSWFTSFGYFDDAGNRAVLAGVAQALAPGGMFLLELNNHTRLVRDFLPSVVVERGADMIVDRNRLDPLTGRSLVTRTILRDGRRRQARFFVRLFPFPELRDWLLAAGFSSVSGYGDAGAPLTAESNRMVVIARR
jgi:SAM-dependent methyltransferase